MARMTTLIVIKKAGYLVVDREEKKGKKATAKNHQN